jgi:general secretion pathway protein G
MFARSIKKGFTLVEILIVVIILGILAAIVIPQFTSASEDARKNSLTSQVQTLRSQVELYKLQHQTDASELFDGAGAAQWTELTNRTNALGSTTIGATETAYGPYLQTVPVNNLNSLSVVQIAAVGDENTFDPADTAGFVYDSTTGKFWATDVLRTRLWLGQTTPEVAP